MSAIEQIEKKLLALPVRDRVFLAESLLGSLPAAEENASPLDDVAAATLRDEEIESGRVKALSESDFWRLLEEDARQ